MNEQEREIIQNFRKFIVILKNILTLNTLNSINNDMREDRLMPKGDKYIEFTNFLRNQHTVANNQFSLSFSEIDTISKNPFPLSTRRYPWGNTAKHSYSISWLKAGYIAKADLNLQRVYFEYNFLRANELLEN